MARQIIDLPEMNPEQLAENDLLVVRDYDQKKDKKIKLESLKEAVTGDVYDIIQNLVSKVAKLEKNIITIWNNADRSYNVTAGGQTTYIFNEDLVVGTLLTRSGSSVIVGEGVTRVKVSANIELNPSASQLLQMKIMLNGSDVTLNALQTNSGQAGLNISPRLIAVSEGDEIGVRFYTASAQSSLLARGNPRNWLTVEVVE